MKPLFTFLIVIALTAITISSQAQSNWKLSKTVDGIECFYQTIICNGDPAILLQFNNTTDQILSISWQEVFNTQLENDITGWKGIKQLNLNPGITSVKSCSDNSFTKCLIIAADVSPTYKALIKSFDFADVTVSKAN